MPTAPTYRELLRSLTLGTARLSPGSEVLEWLDDLGAVDPSADTAEQLLTAYGLLERFQRMQPRSVRVEEAKVPPESPAEDRQPPAPRLARGLQLILEGTYAELLDEGIELVLDRKTYVPPALLPLLIPRAVALLNEDRKQALRYLDAGGQRATWLARQHPDWAILTPEYPFAHYWQASAQPAQKAQILSEWRRSDPTAAREALEKIWAGESPRNQEVLLESLRGTVAVEDWPWLRESLEPKRKGVRRALTELLLLAREPTAIADFEAIARDATGQDGTISANPPGNDMRELLKSYGGTKAPESLGQRLLEIMPPGSWARILEMPVERFWIGLPALELRGAARAVHRYEDQAMTEKLLRFLLREEPKGFPMDLAGDLVRSLDRETFDHIYDELLTREKDALRLRGFSRHLALQRKQSWSERLSKAMISRLLEDLHQRQLDYTTQRDLALHWKQAVPLIDPSVFPWLRKQLHTTTERYDAFGKLATRMLQVTSFRSQLRTT